MPQLAACPDPHKPLHNYLCCLQILNRLVEEAQIPVEKADVAKHKYAKLHAALVKAMTSERSLLDDAKAAKKRLDVREGGGTGKGREAGEGRER
jgi:hypothetical protein